MARILFIEPYHGGSHQMFAKGLIAHSSHTIDCVTLPACNWRWRMAGSALHFARQGIAFDQYDGIMVSGLLRLSDLNALAKTKLPPTLVYFHENQITYPMPVKGKEKRDIQLFMADITTALCAQRVAFNSRYHMNAFLAAIPEFMDHMPDYPVPGMADDILEKSSVLYPGMDFPDSGEKGGRGNQKIPLVIWNHRWSYDKNADSFFYAVTTLADQGLAFELAVLGECPGGRIPESFLKARDRLGPRVVRFGFAEDRAEYIGWLKRGTVAVSTANQENFGMSMVEATRYGCVPLLPHRLSYPEILPERFHGACLYRNQKEFLMKFRLLLTEPADLGALRADVSQAMAMYDWELRIEAFDRELERLCGMTA